ncbi:MAG: glutamine synthetase III [Solitalea-like symbiont of Acarus siro]
MRISSVQKVLGRNYNLDTKKWGKISDIFGKNVFNKEKMRQYLTKEAYNSIINSIERGETIELPHANQIAYGLKTWAIEMGATHYTHWFQPLTEATAEKR